MYTLRLFEGAHEVVDATPPAARNEACALCTRCTSAKTRCLGPARVVGQGSDTLYVLLGEPSAEDDRAGKAGTSDTVKWLHGILKAAWQGHIVYDYAVRCRAQQTGARERDQSAAACRGYLAGVLKELQPARILAVGQVAVVALTARNLLVESIPSSYTWVAGAPCVFLPDLRWAAGNHLLKARLKGMVTEAATVNMQDYRASATEAHVFEQGDDEAAAASLRELVQCEWVAVDTETYGNRYEDDFRIIALALCGKGRNDAHVWSQSALHDPLIAEPLWAFLRGHPLVAHSAKFDFAAIARFSGVQPQNLYADTYLWERILRPDSRGGLALLAERVGLGGHKEEATRLLDHAKRAVRKVDASCGREVRDNVEAYAYALLPPDVLYRYNARDALTTARLAEQLEPELRTAALWPVWKDVQHGMSYAVGRIEQWGVASDRDAIDAFSQILVGRQAELERGLSRFGQDFNPASSTQVGQQLFGANGFGLKTTKFTSGGRPSVDESALEEIAEGGGDAAAFVREVLEHRQCVKWRGTFAEGIKRFIMPDGRVHPSFNIAGAASGRMSCSSPGLQQLPRADSELGKMCRGVFVAPGGRILVQLDFCFARGTLVDTPRGDTPIEALQLGDVVFSYREGARKPSAGKVVQKLCVGWQRILRIGIDNGRFIECTPEHKFLVCPARQDDTPIQVMAKDLQPGCRLLPLKRVTGGGGYTHLYAHKAIEYAKEHIAIAEATYGLRPPGFDVHHLNGDRADNRPENLQYVEEHAHLRVHGKNTATMCWATPSIREKMQRGISAAIARNGGYHGEKNPRWGDRRRRVITQCLHCNKSVECYLSSPRKYCSQKCYTSAKRVGNNHRVLSVQNGGVAECWSIGVDPDKTYALSAGVIVSNSQLELRVMAGLSGDAVMRQVFESGEDLHMSTAKIISQQAWGIPPEQVEKRHRSMAKTVVFGLAYGKEAFGLAKDLGISEREAEAVMEAILGKFSRLKTWIAERQRETLQTGYTWTYWKGERFRRRPLYDIASADQGRAGHARRGAHNTAVQGTASDICFRALCDTVRWIEHAESSAKLVLTVHDSLMLECDKGDWRSVAIAVRGIMESQYCDGVPLLADVEVGRSWGSLEKIVDLTR